MEGYKRGRMEDWKGGRREDGKTIPLEGNGYSGRVGSSLTFHASYNTISINISVIARC